MPDSKTPEKKNIIIIGAGILGCFAARALTRYDVNVTVLESREDVCCGITRANTGIIYQGYDQHPGSLKSEMCKAASLGFPELCGSLDVPYRKTGLMMLSFGPMADKVLEKKLANGLALGLEGLSLIGPEEIYALEPHLKKGARHALLSENTYTVNPWQLGIAAFENARSNGADFRFSSEVTGIERSGSGFIVTCTSGVFHADRVLCCTGLAGDALWNMAASPRVRLVPQDADYLVFDTCEGFLASHVISVEPEEYGEGLTIIPTPDGNLLAGPTRRDRIPGSETEDYSTTLDGISQLMNKASDLLPGISTDSIIRQFGAVRPNPYYVQRSENGDITSGKSINDFLILEEDGLFALVGVKTPGITCANELGLRLSDMIAASFEGSLPANASFSPERRGIVKFSDKEPSGQKTLTQSDPDYGEIICRCRTITKAEILEAIRRGATTINGIKRRTGTGMGRCQGGFCEEKILHILSEESGLSPADITLDGASSGILTGRT